MRNLLLLLLVLSPCLRLAALPVDSEAARRVAAEALGLRLSRSGGNDLTLVRHDGATYLFGTATGHFALTAADDRLPALLAYGTQGGATLPPALVALLKGAQNRLAALPQGTARAATPRQTQPAGPWLTAVRHQEDPFNRHCPFYTADDGTVSTSRCMVGCVATALEEIISYYRRTVTLRDTLHGWTTPHYTIPDVLPGTSVDTRLVRDRYEAGNYTEEEADAVARLSYYCGVAARMNWGLGESGTRIERLEEPLRRAFGYGYVHYLDSYKYRPEDWLSLLEAEMHAGRPVLYAAYTMHLSGHAFVLDGLDEAGMFHVNWGYGGAYDGFFRLDVLTASEPPHDRTEEGLTAGFFCNQEALLLHPDATEALLPDTLQRTGEEIVVDSIVFDLPPETGKYTPLRLYLRNTAPYALTTPFELFTNAPTDTAFFEQGDYVALTGGTLAAGEARMFPVQARFGKGGTRLLRLSPDDVHIVCELPLDVTAGTPARLSFDSPAVSHPDEGTAFVQLTAHNAEDAGRAGHIVTYELTEGADGEDSGDGVRHGHYIYLAGGTSATDTVSFRGLVPGRTYTLLVRCPWTVVQRLTFTQPTSTGIRPSELEDATCETWYAPDGRRLHRPERPGLYVRRQGGTSQKILIR